MTRVLIAVSGEKDSSILLQAYRNLMRPPEEVILLCVRDNGKEGETPDRLSEEETQEKFHDCCRKFQREGLVPVRTIMRTGVPSAEVARAAEEERADLIIMGFTSGKEVDRFIEGNGSDDTDSCARVPVMLARRPRCETAPSAEDDGKETLTGLPRKEEA